MKIRRAFRRIALSSILMWPLANVGMNAQSQAQSAHFAGAQRSVDGGLGSYMIAVDASGNIYVAGFDDGTVKMLAAVTVRSPRTRL